MRRGKERWTHADDKRLGRALLEVFANQGEAVVLSDSCALWKCVQQRYQELVAAEQAVMPNITAAPRSARSLHTRWARGIRPDMILFASLVDKIQKAGKKPAKAVKEAVKLFRGQRSETNAAVVRQFVHERQRTPAVSGDSETDFARPKLKFESFHFRHCYDILCSNPTFIKALLEQGTMSEEKDLVRKRCRTEGASGSQEIYSSSTSSDESSTANLQLESPRTNRFQVTKVDSSSIEQPPRWQNPQVAASGANRTVHPFNAGRSDPGSMVITFEDADNNVDPSRLECDRAVANKYVRLRMQALQEDRRLKLLAELRGIVTTISHLAKQLAWNGVASAALASRTSGVHPGLDQDVLRDIAFFRHEKQRLKQEIAALDELQ